MKQFFSEMLFLKVAFVYFGLFISIAESNISSLEYHNYTDLTSILFSYAQKYPDKTYLYTIGKSVQNRELWVMALADSEPGTHKSLRPEAKYIGNMHGYS